MNRKSRFIYSSLVIFWLGVALLWLPALPAQAQVTFVVNTNNDNNDGTCNAAHCSLREAINAANGAAGTDTITFAIGATGSSQLIMPTTVLPDLAQAVLVDGWSQGGAGYMGPPLIEIDGTNVPDSPSGSAAGLRITASNVTVRGFALTNTSAGGADYGNGIHIESGANNAWIYGNYVGLGLDGATIKANSQSGIHISGANALIGTNGDGSYDTAERNVVSGNNLYGIRFFNGSATVAGNYVGTDATGEVAKRNMFAGIATGNNGAVIGVNGDGSAGEAAEGNLVSGNAQTGILIAGGSNNVVAGNLVGTDKDGVSLLANGGSAGISILRVAQNNRIGTNSDGVSDALERNVINGGSNPGILIQGFSGLNPSANVVTGNFIGVNISGTAALGSSRGVLIEAAAFNNRIGTNGDGVRDDVERNVISGNTYGVYMRNSGTTGNVVAGNFIGTNVNGTAALPNSHGIRIEDNAANNRIGTNGDGNSDAAERNVISGNAGTGIWLVTNAANNIVAGNYIGVDISGTLDLGNGSHGILLQSGANNTRIGTDGNGSAGDSAEGNLISGNNQNGIYLNTSSNVVAGNFIGVNATGTGAIANTAYGVEIVGGVTNNRIGTDGNGTGDTIERNLISGNSNVGINISGSGTTGNVVAGNFIGMDGNGTTVLGNAHGVRMENSAANNRIGTDGDGSNDAAERNLISGNSVGIWVRSNAAGNIIAGNYIGTDITGTLDRGNNSHGILFQSGANNNRIGTDGNGSAGDAAEGNLISGNNQNGIYMGNSGTTGNIVAGNIIGADASGTLAVGNTQNGIYLPGGATNNIVGGDTPATERNIIAFNGLDGVTVIDAATDGNAILGNRIFQNMGIGIDLNDDGASPNDGGDPDTNANQGQNWPIIFANGSYAVDSDPANAGYPLRIEFFATDSNNEEGATLLGFDSYSVSDYNGCGAPPCTKALPGGVSPSTPLVATATDAANNTSEFTIGGALDTTPPDTTIDSSPSDPSISSDATFIFSGTDDVTAPGNLTFECQLDGGSFVACSTPQTYNSLADGSHTFAVRAIDEAGNVDPSPSSSTWAVARMINTSVTQISVTTVYTATPQACSPSGNSLPTQTIAPTMRNTATSTFSGLFFRVKTLEYTVAQGGQQPLLCNATTGNGGVGSTLVIPDSSLPGGDNQFNPGEDLLPVFQVGLPVQAQFRIKVDLYSTSVTAASAEGTIQEGEYLGSVDYTFDETGQLTSEPHQLFLPLVNK